MMLWCASSSITRRADGSCAEKTPAEKLLARASSATWILMFERIVVA
jgi:hypothetical protein